MGKPRPITAFGIEYPSLKAAALAFDHKVNTFHRYMITYRTEPEAFLASRNFLVRFGMCGIDSRAYYRVPWSDRPVTTREIVSHCRPDLLAAYDATNPTGEYRPYLLNINGGKK